MTDTIEAVLAKFDSVIIDQDRGYIVCPGADFHTTQDSAKDCILYRNPDGTIIAHCQHRSCGARVASLNRELMLFARSSGMASRPASGRCGASAPRRAVAQLGASLLLAILGNWKWSYADIQHNSPEELTAEAEDHWYYILDLFHEDDVVWIGDTVNKSGRPAHSRNFRTVREWMGGMRACPGDFICPNSFVPGAYSRCNANVLLRKFLVVESDILSKDEVGAIFRWLDGSVNLRLRAVVDAAGKSLHGWFDYPSEALLKNLRIILPALKCDDKLFSPSQPCRLPGALRGQNRQKLIYLNNNHAN